MLEASCRLFVILPNALLLLSIAVAQDGDVVDVHDPCVIKEGQTYYLFSTGGRLPMRRSRDLKHWSRKCTL